MRKIHPFHSHLHRPCPQTGAASMEAKLKHFSFVKKNFQSRSVYMVSPNNPGPCHTQKSMHIAAIHELTHFFIFKKAKKDLPLWMHEGLASFEAGMFGAKSIDHMAHITEMQGIPSLSKLSEFDSNVFCELGGYAFSYTLIEFIVQRWDFNTLLKIVQRFDRFEEILGLSLDTFASQWKEFVTKRYLANHQWPH